MYAYQTYNIKELEIKELDIPIYLSTNSFIKPKINQQFSNLYLFSEEKNIIDNEQQYIIVVYCSGDENCLYTLCFSNSEFDSVRFFKSVSVRTISLLI